MKKLETYRAEVFDNMIIDILMKNENITEQEAKNKLNNMYETIDLFSENCRIDKHTFSIREGIWNNLIELGYITF
jgi:hypothetical protein